MDAKGVPVPARERSYLPMFAALTSVFAVVLVAIVAAAGFGAAVDNSTSNSPPAPVPVKLSEYAISPAAVTVAAQGSIDVTNTGSMAHNLSIVGQNLKTADIPAGGKANLDLSGLNPGTYQLYCAVTGHKDLGMVATLKVTPAASSSKNGAATGSTASSDMAGMPGMSGSSGSSSTSGSADVSTMKPGSAAANKMNAQMEKAMTGGVNSFLAYAKKYAAGSIKTANPRLRPTVLADGTKQFDLTAAITNWEVSPGKVVKAWTYNGTAPGPWIKVDPGRQGQGGPAQQTSHLDRHPLPWHRRAKRSGRGGPDHPEVHRARNDVHLLLHRSEHTESSACTTPTCTARSPSSTACSPCSRSVTWRSPGVARSTA